MRQNLICSGQRFVAVLILAISLSTYGCKDSVSISDNVEVPLSSLAITPGSLQPAFFSNTTNYTVDVSTTVTSVTVTASPKESTTTMTINGTDTMPGQGRSVPLSSSETTTNIIIVLTNQNGIESTYDIVVRKVDNNLSALSVTEGSLVPAFAAGTLTYQVDVGSGVSSVTVSATKLDPRAVMSGAVNAGAGVATGTATMPLNEPGIPTEVSITVAVPNGEAKTYTITMHRADNNLSALTVTPGTLDPAFAANTLSYTVNVATDIDKVTVTATKSDPNAFLFGSVPDPGTGQATGQAIIPLNGAGAPTSVSITVTAQNTVDSKTYTVTVNRALPAAPSAPTLAPDLISEDDSGFLPGQNSDNITNVTTPRFLVPQPGAGETPSLYIDGIKVAADFDQGANTLRPTAPLSEGAHAITYTMANAGGESAQSPPLSVTIDTSSPLPL